MARVRELTGRDYPYTIAYQGQAAQKPSVPNRIRWVGPDVEAEIPRLAEDGVKALVIVPISFLYEQRGTLYMQARAPALPSLHARARPFAPLAPWRAPGSPLLKRARAHRSLRRSRSHHW
jgi:hypothetical protein